MILIIEGPHDAAVEFAQRQRGQKISAGQGALLVLRPTPEGDHALHHQVEKITADRLADDRGAPLTRMPAVSAMQWKPGTVILVPEAVADVLNDIEAMLPGFTEHFGPVRRVEPF